MKERFIKWLRWLIAWRFLFNSQKHCWTHVCMWAEYPQFHDWGEIRWHQSFLKECRGDCERYGNCYCGRMERQEAEAK